MDTKTRLTRYPALHQEVLLLCDRAHRLEQAGTIADPVELNEIEQQASTHLDEMEALRALIRTLPDVTEQMVLTLRYVDGINGKPLKWKEVAQKMLGGTAEKHLKMVFRWHRSALDHLELAAK